MDQLPVPDEFSDESICFSFLALVLRLHVFLSLGQFQPLFLFVSMQAPHAPLQVDNKYMQLYRGIDMGNKNRRTIAGMISCMDEAIGNITKALKDSGLYDKSVILFSSGNCSNRELAFV